MIFSIAGAQVIGHNLILHSSSIRKKNIWQQQTWGPIETKVRNIQDSVVKAYNSTIGKAYIIHITSTDCKQVKIMPVLAIHQKHYPTE